MLLDFITLFYLGGNDKKKLHTVNTETIFLIFPLFTPTSNEDWT